MSLWVQFDSILLYCYANYFKISVTPIFNGAYRYLQQSNIHSVPDEIIQITT